MTLDFKYNPATGIAYLECSDSELFEDIRSHFSAHNSAGRFAKFAPARLYAITPTGRFKIGMYLSIMQYAKSVEPDVIITMSDKFKLSATCGLNVSPALIENCSLDLHYYQRQVVERSLLYGRGTIVVGTGGGKTLICATLINSFYQNAKNKKDFRCIFVVPDIGLVNQTYNELVDEFGAEYSVCKWSFANDLNDEANIIVASSKLMVSRHKREKWIQSVDLVVVDECHKIKSNNKITKIITEIKTPNKFGCTGTLPDDNISKWNIIGIFGPVLFEKDSAELREEGFLTNVTVRMVNVEYKSQPTYPKASDYEDGIIPPHANYKAELEFIYFNEFRNRIVQTVTTNFKNNILILVNHIAHGEELERLLSQNTDHSTFFVQGSVDVDARDIIKATMEETSNTVCIAMSSIFSTGINIKNIHMIILAGGGKAFIRTVQSIGRGLRLHITKDKLIIIDIVDNLKYGLRHAAARENIYIKEKIDFLQTYLKES